MIIRKQATGLYLAKTKAVSVAERDVGCFIGSIKSECCCDESEDR
jgi:hypothetical protein